MSGVTGIDIAWDRPTIAQIKATGARWVGRYFSTDPSKNLTAAEVRDYHAAGLGIVTVWETTTARATQGYQAGIDDANLAEGQRKTVGLPADHVHHFAVDMDTDWASVEPYFQGVEAVIGKPRTGCYGGRRVIEGAHAAGIKYLWQTVAWSGGVWLPYATIRQPYGTTLNGAADYDTAETPDFGQYPRPSEVDMDATQNQMLVDIHNWLAYKGYDYRNAAEDAASLKASGGKTHSPDAWGKLSGAFDGVNTLKAEVSAVQKAVSGLAVPQLTPAQVQGLAAALAPALVPVLVPALVEAMGHALDGTKPPAKP
jgi:Domain of unknown function (DUF1906)